MLPENDQLRIAIVDDHPVVIEGLERILHQAFGSAHITSFVTGELFLQYLQQGQPGPDIVLLDITLPGMNGVELCREIKRIAPRTAVLAFSNHSERSLVMKMLHYGASGYLLKNAPAGEVIACIEKALNHQLAFSSEITAVMTRTAPTKQETLPSLTKREQEILTLIADGHTSVAIAAMLHLSPLTVETHRRNLMHKFEVKNVAELVKMFTRQQLV